MAPTKLARRSVSACLALLAVTAVHAQSCVPLASPQIIADFNSATRFNARQNDLNGPLTDAGSMHSFVRDSRIGSGALSIIPATINSFWSTGVPVSVAATLPLNEAHGAVFAFELGRGDNADFIVALEARKGPRNALAQAVSERFEILAQPYVPSSGSGTWVTVRIPIAHFAPMADRYLMGITFSRFAGPYGAGARTVRFDNVRIEYHNCPLKSAVLPPQSCRASTLTVDNFLDVTRFNKKLNVLGGQWSDDGTMTSIQRLSSTQTHGPGMLLTGTNTSYWYTILMQDQQDCFKTTAYTTLRIRVAASIGAQFTIQLRQRTFDCQSFMPNFASIPTSSFTTFDGLGQIRTIDIPFNLIGPNPAVTVAIANLHRPTGAPTDGQAKISVVVKDIAFVRDCQRLLQEQSQVVPPLMDWCGPSDVPLMALTFDGPAAWTDSILDYLKAEKIPATFFVQPGVIFDRSWSDASLARSYDAFGYPLQPGPSSHMCRLVKRIVEEGHTLADHSFTHPRYPSLQEGHLRAETERPIAFYKDCLGYVPSLFRPPFGELTPAQLPALSALNYSVALWNLESFDHLPDANVTATVMAQIERYQSQFGQVPPSTIFLMHEQFTNVQLPSVIDYLRSLNYRFITMHECRERCITRSRPSQPAWQADHRACWDPRNPTDYSTWKMFYGQSWHHTIPMSTWPSPPPLGSSYAFMPAPSVPFAPPSIFGLPSTPLPHDAPPEPVLCSISSTHGGSHLVIQPTRSFTTCVAVYTDRWTYIDIAPVQNGAAKLPSSVFAGATSFYVEEYIDAECTSFATFFGCSIVEME